MTTTETMEKSNLSTKETTKTLEESQLSANEPNHNPKAFTTKKGTTKRPKAFDKTTKRKQPFSITDGMLSSIVSDFELEGLLEGELVHLSFDCPKTLRARFKQATRHNKTNVCDELQKFMASYILSYELKKHALGNTMSKVLPVEFSIGEISLHQYCQSKPRRWVNHGNTEGDAESIPESKLACTIIVDGVACGKPAYARATFHASLGHGNYRDTEFAVCEQCYRDRVRGNGAWMNVMLLEVSS